MTFTQTSGGYPPSPPPDIAASFSCVAKHQFGASSADRQLEYNRYRLFASIAGFVRAATAIARIGEVGRDRVRGRHPIPADLRRLELASPGQQVQMGVTEPEERRRLGQRNEAAAFQDSDALSSCPTSLYQERRVTSADGSGCDPPSSQIACQQDRATAAFSVERIFGDWDRRLAKAESPEMVFLAVCD